MKPLSTVAKAGHEMKNTLTLLQANIATIQSSLVSTDQPLLVREMTTMYQHTQRLVDLLTSLVMEATLEPEAFVPLDLNQLVHGVVAEYQQIFGNVRFTLDTVPTLMVLGSADGLLMLVRNIIDNALQYGQKHDAVPEVQIKLYSRHRFHVVEISDTGPGIAKQDLSKVCIPYYRGGNAGAVPGSGLGLAIVEEIVMKHHGKLHVANALTGTGVTVTVMLPQLKNK